MGPSSDPYAVVSPRLQVYGIKNLRVVDSSIMPEIVAGHTNAAAFMIGDKLTEKLIVHRSNTITASLNLCNLKFPFFTRNAWSIDAKTVARLFH